MDPIHLEKLRGKVVLLDFWTYCCINCHHVLPDLATTGEEVQEPARRHRRAYSPKFDAEKETENIRDKVREYQIKPPGRQRREPDYLEPLRRPIAGRPSSVINASGDSTVQGPSPAKSHGAELDKP